MRYRIMPDPTAVPALPHAWRRSVWNWALPYWDDASQAAREALRMERLYGIEWELVVDGNEDPRAWAAYLRQRRNASRN